MSKSKERAAAAVAEAKGAEAELRAAAKRAPNPLTETIVLGMSRAAAEYILDAVNAFDPDDEHELHRVIAAELNDQLGRTR